MAVQVVPVVIITATIALSYYIRALVFDCAGFKRDKRLLHTALEGSGALAASFSLAAGPHMRVPRQARRGRKQRAAFGSSCAAQQLRRPGRVYALEQYMVSKLEDTTRQFNELRVR